MKMDKGFIYLFFQNIFLKDFEINNIETTVNSTKNDKFLLKLSSKDLIELGHIERSFDCDETIDIRMLLSDILNDREANTPRSERLFRFVFFILYWGAGHLTAAQLTAKLEISVGTKY
jgi:hypothetical protein